VTLNDRVRELFERADAREARRLAALEERLTRRVDRTDALLGASLDELRRDVRAMFGFRRPMSEQERWDRAAEEIIRAVGESQQRGRHHRR